MFDKLRLANAEHVYGRIFVDKGFIEFILEKHTY